MLTTKEVNGAIESEYKPVSAAITFQQRGGCEEDEGDERKLGVRQQKESCQCMQHRPLEVPYATEPGKAVVDGTTETHNWCNSTRIKPDENIENYDKKERE